MPVLRRFSDSKNNSGVSMLKVARLNNSYEVHCQIYKNVKYNRWKRYFNGCFLHFDVFALLHEV